MTNQDSLTVRIEKVNFRDLQAGDYVRILPLNLDPMTEMLVEKISESAVYFAHPFWEKEDFGGETVIPSGRFNTAYFSCSKDGFDHLNYQVTRTVKIHDYFRACAVRQHMIFENLAELEFFLNHYNDR